MKISKNKMCYPRFNKKGEIISYRFFFSGKDPITGKPKQYTKTWKVPNNLPIKEVELQLKQAELEFIKESQKKSDGIFVSEDNITFETFAKQWLDRILKSNPDSYSHYVRSAQALKLLNDYFGRYYLKQISPLMIQRFYDYLCERTYTKEVVTVNKSINELIQEKGLHKSQLAEECGINRLTLRLASNVGNQISISTAKAISDYFKVPLTKYFKIEKQEVHYSKSTNAGTATILRIILGEAKRQQLIEHNYATREYTKPLTGTTKSKEIFNESEARQFVKAVLKETHPKKKTMLALLIFMGLRKGEIFGLSWKNIDFDNKTITIENNTIYFRQFGTISKSPKTQKSHRTIKMPDLLVDILTEYRDWYRYQKTIHGDLWANTDNLFIQDNGKIMNPCTLNSWLKKFNLENGFKNIPPHSLRHTCISLQITAGIPIKTVSERAGHSSERITLDIYTHTLQSQDIQAAEIYNKFLIG